MTRLAPQTKDGVVAAACMVALFIFVSCTETRQQIAGPVPVLMDGTAMCDTDTECEEMRRDLCEAARDDNSTSEYCKEDEQSGVRG